MEKMKNNSVALDKVCDLLKENNNFVILPHSHPDGDAVGSCYGLAYILQKMGKNVKIKSSDPIPEKFAFLTADFTEQEFDEEFVISVDVGSEGMLGRYKEEYEGKIDLEIDHHATNDYYAANCYVVSQVAANCENIYDIAVSLNVEIDKMIANCLFTGIATDTGCFKFTNVSAGTHLKAAKLIECGAEAGIINKKIFDTKSQALIRLESAIMQNLEYYYDGEFVLVILTKNILCKCGATDNELDGINSLAATVEGVKVGITVKERKKGIYKASVRTISPVDAAEICAEFGGGGHKNAAGCEFRCSIEDMRDKLLEVVGKHLENNE